MYAGYVYNVFICIFLEKASVAFIRFLKATQPSTHTPIKD